MGTGPNPRATAQETPAPLFDPGPRPAPLPARPTAPAAGPDGPAFAAPEPIPTAVPAPPSTPATPAPRPVPAPRPRPLVDLLLPFGSKDDADAASPLSEAPLESTTAPPPPAVEELTVSARMARTWQPDAVGETGPGAKNVAAALERVTLLRGDVTLKQAGTTVTAPAGVMWRRPNPAGTGELVSIYLEDGVRLDEPGRTETHPTILMKLEPDALTLDAREIRGAPGAADPLLARAEEQRKYRGASTRTTRLGPPDRSLRSPLAGPGVSGPAPPAPPPRPAVPGGTFGRGRPIGAAGGVRRIQLLPRSAVNPSVKSFESDRTLPPEQVTAVTGGVRLIIDGLTLPGGGFGDPLPGEPTDQISLAAENVVVWTRAAGAGAVVPGVARVQPADFPLTVYLEGDIEIRQGRNVIRARRAVYDVRADRALITDAELTTILPGVGPNGAEGAVRIKARQLRQLAEDRFRATNAWSTTSQSGVPGFRLQSGELFLEPRYDDVPRLTGEPAINPATGRLTTKSNWIRSYDNTLILNNPITGDVPVLYAPYIAGPAEDPNIPIRNGRFGNSDERGFEAELTLDPFSLFGVQQPTGVVADLLVGGYSDRGFAAGVRGSYENRSLFGLPGYGAGDGIAWFVQDDGLDRLGLFRRDIEPTQNFRYRLRARHQQILPEDYLAGRSRLIFEAGKRSDINVLEAWWENDWDRGPDEDTRVYGTGSFDNYGFSNWSWEALGQVRTNDFETDTGWYPKLDLYGLGEPLLGGLVTYSQHSSAGYGDLDPADYPEGLGYKRVNPLFTDLPYVADRRGGVFLTRHELSAPLWAGPLNVTPFVMGEGASQQEGLDGGSAVRAAGSVGVRAALPFSRVWRGVRSRTLGLNGLAHKVRLEAEYRATGTSAPLGEFAQYNPLDDDPQQQYRARIPRSILDLPPGFPAPAEIDPRIYGVRTGVGLDVTSPVWELVQDQQVLRLAARQRLQTKVGAPGFERIKDWMTLDLSAAVFPNADRDNFGETFGLVSADYAWNVGDRTRFTAGATYDFFEGAPQQWDVGFLTQRTRRGSAYAGVRHVEAFGIDATQLIGSYSYRMGPKWASTASAFMDLDNADNSGTSLTLTRIGADFNVSVGVRHNNIRDDTGLIFQIEPRFASSRSDGLLGPQPGL